MDDISGYQPIMLTWTILQSLSFEADDRPCQCTFGYRIDQTIECLSVIGHACDKPDSIVSLSTIHYTSCSLTHGNTS